MATSFTVNKADLEFILKQIKISEASSIGYTPAVAPVSIQQAIMDAYGLSAADAAIAPFGLRTVDGSFNSLVAGQDKFGAADTLFPRLTRPVYRNDTDGDSIDFDGSGGMSPVVQGNYGNPGNVVDADPRIISNLIVDMSVNNPAAIAAYLGNPLSLAQFEADHPGRNPVAPGDEVNLNDLAITNIDLQTIPNQSPDIGLSPGFNAWMTFFGQFFDHGLDLVTKGGAGTGTVYVPLQADDPLINGPDGIAGNADDLPPHLQFMALTRATPTMVDPDGPAGPLPAQRQHENTTTSFVDQNQTYTSHPSHQVFLREYAKFDTNGAATPGGEVTVSTGRLIDGKTANGSHDRAIGNWAEVKAQALTMLGINLRDIDVLNVPLLLTDQYGKFIAGPNGYAQLVMAPDAEHATNWLKEGKPDGSVTTAGSISTNHAFLNDLAHNAVPGTFYDPDGPAGPLGLQEVQADADTDSGNAIPVDFMGRKMAYDDELLAKHFITGDGRGNENIALTAVHSIFHSEHNRLVDVNKVTLLADAAAMLAIPGTTQAQAVAFLNEWLVVDVAAVPTTPAQIDALAWDGERLFQAARFGTEMQYQHMVFEEFARRIQPMVDPFIFNSSPDVDPSIVAEFAHTVYRFGHSMLTGTVDRLDANLNPLDPLDPDSIQGQQTLLAVFLNPQAYIGSGATLEEVNANIIRGLSRDVGNAMDEFIVTDVRSNLLGLPLDLAVLNIARGRETGIPSLNETRAQLYNDTGLADLKPYESWADFAMNIKNAASVVNFIAAYGTHSTITGVSTLAAKRDAAEAIVFGGPGAPLDRVDFLNATGTWAPDAAGPNDDTRGGLNLIDLWLGGLAEESPEFGGMLGTTFNYVFEYQMEALQFGDRMYYLTRTQGLNFLNNLEPNSFSDIVMRNTELGDQYSTHLNGQLFVTPDHIIELDRGIAQEDYNGAAPGEDPIWDGSNPVLEALQGPKVLRNYTGATTIVDDNGTPSDPSDDVTHDVGGLLRVIGGEHYVLGGTEGNDKIYGDSGMDTLWGDGGDDYLNGMTEADDVFGGAGNDIIEDPFGEGDVLRGNQGHDVISSARGADLLFGDQGQDYIMLGQDAAEVFGGTETDFILGGMGKDFLLGNEGDDWIEGGGGFDTIAGENSELFFNSPIIGHDVLFGHGDETDYDAESGDDIMGSGPSVYRYEGMFGFDWGIAKNDHSQIRFDLQIPIFTTIPEDTLRDRFDQTEALSGWTSNDILDGDDRGHSGGSSSPDSVPTQLFTDHLLTAEGIDRISGLRQVLGGTANVADPIKGIETLFGLGKTTFRDGNILIGGDGNDMIRGRGGYDIIDGDAWLNVRIKIVLSETKVVDGVTYAAGTVLSAESLTTDTVVMGPNAGKVFRVNPDGSPDFANVAFGGRSLNSLVLDRTINPGDMSIVREILDGTVAYGDNFDTASYTDDDGAWTQNWEETNDGAGVGVPNSGDIQIVSFNGGNQLRFGESTDGNEIITRAVNLTGIASAKLSFSWTEDDRDDGENVLVQALNLNTNAWETIGTMLGSAANGTGTASFDLTAAQVGVNSAIRFQTVGAWSNGENFYIDNVSVGDNATDTDTAIFQGGNLEYEIEGTRIVYDGTTGEALRRVNIGASDNSTAPLNIRDVDGDGFIRVKDLDDGLVAAPGRVGGLTVSRGALTDDTDLLKNMERLQFADGTLSVGLTPSNAIATGTVTISDPSPFVLDHDGDPTTAPISVVSPIVGQVLTATAVLYDRDNDANGDGDLNDVGDTPIGPVIYEWQTTEAGNDGGWATIQTSLTYTVRPVDPAHVLRAVAVFTDKNGVTERVASQQTDNVTAPFFVNENSPTNTVVAATIPFSLDYDPLGFGGTGVTDGDVVQLTHVISPDHNAGGRFKIVDVNTDPDHAPIYQLQVANGGPQMLNYEAGVHTPANQSHQFVDNQYQIVIETYTDTIANGGVLVAQRQFTIFINDVTGEIADIAPTLDLQGAVTTTNGNYRETFAADSYSGTDSDGTIPWTTNWDETNDDDSDDGGDIEIVSFNGSNQLRFDDSTDGGESISRAVNLAGRASATLTFDYIDDDTGAGQNIVVEAWDGDSWEAVGASSVLGSTTGNGGGSFSGALSSAQISANSAIRFRAVGDWNNGDGNDDNFYIDNVNIAFSTTTVAPAAPFNYTTTFTEGSGVANGTPVQIALNPALSDTDNPTLLMGATVRLTNAKPLDALTVVGAVNGVLPSGIVVTTDSTMTGVITLYLSGPASLANMQAAIQAVRFSNTSQNADTTDRVINVTVNDGEKESNIATATVTVASTNDAPDAVNDAVITNFANGANFTIPEWALLANDTDVDSLTLDVTAVGGASNLTGLSLVTNPGSVTMARTATGNASFTYTASDGPATDVATASVAQSVASTTLSEAFGSTSYTTDDGAWTQDWVETDDDGSSTAANGQIAITGNELVFDAGNNAAASNGASIQRTVNLTGATSANLSFDYDENNFDAGETVLVQFSDDGTFSAGHIQLVQTINNNSGEGSSNIALSGAFGANSAIRFVVSGMNTGDGDNVQIDNINVTYTTPSTNISAGAGNQILVGDLAGSMFNGGAGNDIIFAGAGNDTINWSVGDGRDFVDGGAGTLDRVIINGNNNVETFNVYSNTDDGNGALPGTLSSAALAGFTGLNASTEIVITRDGVVIAELDNIEEITINTGGGADTVTPVGNFAPTSLNFNTITINGDNGDDTVDISALTSAHRIVFRSNGGNDTIIGNLRPQDVIELPAGAMAADYTTTTDANGVSTMTDGTHSITFTALSGMPQFGNDDDEDDDDTAGNDDDNDDDDNDDCGCDDDDTDTTGNSPIIGGQRTGTPVADVLTGDDGDDNIVAFAGDDIATGNAGADTISTGEGADFASGGDGRDVIFAGAGDDQVFGGGQADIVYGDAGADRIFGEGGNDLITAGAGDDAVFGGAGNDLIVAEIGDGNDVYFGDDSDGGTGVDTLDMSAATVGVTVNLGSGPLSNGTASSTQTGNDTIWGIENVNTGSGSDTITASNAANVMNGGAGNDTYRFTSASAADGDTILGFEPGDRVDLSAIDTTAGTAGDQGFTLVSGAFTAVGQLAVTFETRANGEDVTVIEGNTGGDAAADFTIEIAGHHDLTPGTNLGL